MGLDMYLTTESDTELGYWRKANAIHLWFVREVQNNNDECERHLVTKEKLEELKALCEEVVRHSKLVPGNVYCGTKYSPGKEPERMFESGRIIEDPSYAIEHLPTGSGFFFGGTDYDEWYLQKVEDTIKFCTAALAQDKPVYYQSSW